MWGTGLGAVPFPDNQPATAGDIGSGVEIFVGGKLANAQYYGRAPGYSGLDQINFVVPAGLDGCAVSLAVRVSNRLSNFTSIAVAPDGQDVCNSGDWVSSALAFTAPSGKVIAGLISLATSSAFVSFYQYDYQSLIRSAQVTQTHIAAGDCWMQFYGPNGQPPADPFSPAFVYPWQWLYVKRPDGTTVEGLAGLPNYADVGFLVAGTYQVSPGPPALGTIATFGPFLATLVVPSSFNNYLKWSSGGVGAVIPRNQDLTVTWTASDTTANVFVSGNTTRSLHNTAQFICRAPAGATSLTVPSYVLGALPQTTSGGGFFYVSLNLPGPPFTAPQLYAGQTSLGIQFNTELDYQ